MDQTPLGDVPILSDQEAQLRNKLLLPVGPDGVLVDLDPVDSPPFDPTALPSLPRVENQYNMDYVDRFHARNHGRFFSTSP